jgi:predicted TIM-barrel fold metal-dependent hydrolase
MTTLDDDPRAFSDVSFPRQQRHTLLPDPEPRPPRYLLISVDDHLVEPRDVFLGRLPASLAEHAPRVVEDDEGVEWWLIEGRKEPNIGANSVVGRPREEWSAEPTRYDEMRRGVWDIHERVRDMDINGVYASLCFPSMVFGFAGQRFLHMKDRELGLACVKAYNDWIIEEWASPYPERIIPCQVPWLRDPSVAAEEVRRNAARGFKAVAFTENPELLGLPSIHSGHWDPFLAACEETDTVVNLHVGSSSQITRPSTDSPPDVTIALFTVNALTASVDWLFSRIPVRFPGIKVVFSEGGFGWVPMVLDRLEYLETRTVTLTWQGVDVTPAEAFRRNFWFTSYWDPSSFALRDRIGLDHLMIESDYPHADTTWPDTQARMAEQLEGMPEADVRRITHENAAALYRHPLPAAAR